MQHTDDFPPLTGTQVVLVRAEASTGIVLLPSGDRRLGSGPRYTVFESIPEAEQYAAAFLWQHPSAECWLGVSPDNFFRRITATSDESRNA